MDEELTDKQKERFYKMISPPIVFLNEKENAYYFSKAGGPFLIPWQEAKKLIRGLIKYYNMHSEEYIEKLNDEMNKVIYEQMTRKGPPKLKPLPVEGYIYLLLADNGMVKIGKTINLENRIKQISPKLPYKTEVVRVFKMSDYVKAEKLFHEYYDSKRFNQSEWFMLTNKDWEEYWDNGFPKQIKDLIIEEE